MAGAPKGNNNGGKGRDWLGAIQHALNDYSKGKVARGLALREIAKTLITKAIDGDMAAIKEIGDRLDGKAHQTLEATIRQPTLAEELSDAELANIAATSSKGTSKQKERPKELH